MGFLDFIQMIIEKGYAALAGTGIFGIVALVFQFKNTKLSKDLFNKNNLIESFKAELAELKNDLKNAEEYAKNSNEIVSAVIDLIHVAYSGSSLDVAVKLQLQKIYDKCPEAYADVKDKLMLTLEEQPTEEQIEEVNATDTDAAVNAIIEKLK